MRIARPLSRRGSCSAAWFVLALPLALLTHEALATCLGSGCSDQGVPSGITTLYRRIAAWTDFTEPLAVLRLGRPAAALHFLPLQRGQTEAAGGWLAVGDDAGGLHLLSLDGRVVAQYRTGTASPVTSLGSYRFGHNTTVVLTGHASGELRLHALLAPPEAQQQQQQGGSSWEDAAAGGPPPSLALLEAVAAEDLMCGTPAAAACASSSGGGGGSGSGGSGSTGACAASPSCVPITSVHSSARGGMAAATVVAADGLGRVAVLKHGGPTGLGVRVVRRAALDQGATALRLSGAAATVLGSSGTASQPLSQPAAAADKGAAGQHPHEAQAAQGEAGAAGVALLSPAFKSCRGLGGSSIVAAVFDGHHSNRAYAASSNGSMLALVVGGGRGALPACTVRSSAPLPAGLLPPPQQGSDGKGGDSLQQQQQHQAVVQLAGLPGYVIVAAAGGQLAVFNVTAAPRGPPRLLLHQPLSALAERFGVAAAAAAGAVAQAPPLMATGRQGQHVVLMLNATVLAVYGASFPYRPPPQPNKGALAWMQVLQPMAMVGVAVVVLAKARARRGGGDASDFGLGGGRGGLAGDPRLREFERLLQNPLTAGATARQRHRPWGDSSGSEMEDCGGGRARGGVGSRGAGGGKNKQGSGAGGLLGRPRSGVGGLLGRPRTGAGGGGSSGGGSRGREARWRRAASQAAGDDADIAALRAELAGGGLGGGSEDDEMELEGGAHTKRQMGGDGSGGFGSVLSEDAGRRGSDDLSQLSQLRQRFGRASIS